jgi:hypothetical protein
MFAFGIAFAISACGGDDETTTSTETDIETTTQQTQSQPTATTSAPKPTTTTSTAAGPGACGPNQAFSQVSKTCVNTKPSGNPCPKGEVPMADRPICVKE